MNIKVLFENTKINSQFKQGHGLSILINYSDKKYLFDTGANRKLIYNAAKLNESLTDLDGVILSHGHSDHTGGLPYLPTNETPIYALNGVTEPHYLKIFSLFFSVGLSTNLMTSIKKNFNLITSTFEVMPNFYIFPLGKSTSITKNLYKKSKTALIFDDFSDELMVIIEQGDGLIVFTGCSHHGIVAMAKEALDRFSDKPINYLIGGFHMIGIPYLNNLGMNKSEIVKIGQALTALPIKKILTGHCTGIKAFSILKEQLGTKIEPISTGQQIELI